MEVVSQRDIGKETEGETEVSITRYESESPRICFLFAGSTFEMFCVFCHIYFLHCSLTSIVTKFRHYYVFPWSCWEG